MSDAIVKALEAMETRYRKVHEELTAIRGENAHYRRSVESIMGWILKSKDQDMSKLSTSVLAMAGTLGSSIASALAIASATESDWNKLATTLGSTNDAVAAWLKANAPETDTAASTVTGTVAAPAPAGASAISISIPSGSDPVTIPSGAAVTGYNIAPSTTTTAPVTTAPGSTSILPLSTGTTDGHTGDGSESISIAIPATTSTDAPSQAKVGDAPLIPAGAVVG